MRLRIQGRAHSLEGLPRSNAGPRIEALVPMQRVECSVVAVEPDGFVSTVNPARSRPARSNRWRKGSRVSAIVAWDL
jgi:hypothetical protein